MRKFITLIALILCISTCLSSCVWINSIFKKQDQEDDSSGTEIPLSEYISFYLADRTAWNYSDFIHTVAKGFNKYPRILNDGASMEGILFSVGDMDGSSFTRAAYDSLDRHYSGDPNNSCWLIYSNGCDICIAYGDILARNAAVDYFLENLIGSADSFKKGVVAYDEFNTADYVDACREESRAEDLAAFEAKLGSEAARAMESLTRLVDDEMYVWLANLWDPDIGGFYYSASARDTEGFLPDIESTAQALNILESSGMLELYINNYSNALPEQMKAALLNFAKELQSSKDGYFYHPQWGEDITTSRRGRDLGWATRIIKKLGAIPYYDTPNGVKGENSIGSSAALTSRLGDSSVSAASKVVATASSLPDYLQNTGKWQDYLENLWLDYNSYQAGNTLNSITGQISKAGNEYKEILHKFLDNKQNQKTGVWEPVITYDAINGLMKICGVYSSFGWTIPNAEKALSAAMEIALRPDGAAHVCSVYNPWVAMDDLIDSIKKSDGKESAEELRAMIRAQAAELITVTVEKISVFKKNDGGFSYYVKYSNPTSQGASVAVYNTTESDVNATSISGISISKYITNTLGVDRVYQFCDADFQYFMLKMEELGTIIKDDIPAAKVVTFDDNEASGYEMGVLQYPHYSIETFVGDTDADSYGNYKWFRANVVQNPTGTDSVLMGENSVYSDEEKKVADAASRFAFYMVNAAAPGDTYIFETDIFIESATALKDGVVGQFFFGNDSSQQASLNLKPYTDENGVKYIRFGENYVGADGIKNDAVAGALKIGEWQKLRIEMYKIYEYEEVSGATNRTLSIKLKVFINGEFQGTCDAGYTSSSTGKYYDRKVTRAAISFYRHSLMKLYLNNVYVSKSADKYVETVNPDAVVNDPVPNEEMRDVTNFEDGMLNTSNVLNKKPYSIYGVNSYANSLEGEQAYNPYIIYTIANDPIGATNKVLKMQVKEGSATSGRTEVYLSNPEDEGYTYIFNGRFYYDEIENNQDITQITLKNSGEFILYALRVIPYDDSSTGKKGLKLVEYNNQEGGNGSGKTLCTGIESKAWFDLRIEFIGTDGYTGIIAETTGKEINNSTMTTKIYINDVLVSEDNSFRRNNFARSEVLYLGISHQRNHDQIIYLDNLSLLKGEATVDSEIPGGDSTGGTTGGDSTGDTTGGGSTDEEVIPDTSVEGAAPNVTDFSGSAIYSDYVKHYDTTDASNLVEILGTTENATVTKFSLATDPTNAANQVLKVEKVKGAANYRTTITASNSDQSDANCVVFEMKMYSSKVQYDTHYIDFYGDVNGEAKKIFGLYMYQKDGKTFQLREDNGTGKNTTQFAENLSAGSLPIGAWFTLRIELYRGGTTDTSYAKIFVDIGDGSGMQCIADGNYTAGNATAAFTEVRIRQHTTRAGVNYFDDISVSYVRKAYVAESAE